MYKVVQISPEFYHDQIHKRADYNVNNPKIHCL